MTCVMDANVLLKAAVAEDVEPLAGAACAIREPLAQRFGLTAPWLVVWEVGNVVHRKAPEAFGDDLGERSRVVELLLRDLTLADASGSSLKRTGDLVEAHGLTFYDAAYLELAERHEGLLITEDRSLLREGREVLDQDRCLDVVQAFAHVQDGVL